MTEKEKKSVEQIEGEDAQCPHCANDDPGKILGSGKAVPLRMCKECGRDWIFDCEQLPDDDKVQVINMTGQELPAELKEFMEHLREQDGGSGGEALLGAIEIMMDANEIPSPEEMVDQMIAGIPDEMREVIGDGLDDEGFKAFLAKIVEKIGRDAGIFGQLSQTNVTAKGYPWMEDDGTYRKSFDINHGVPAHEVASDLRRMEAHLMAAEGPGAFARWLNDWFSTIFEAWRGLPFRGKDPDNQLFTRRYIEVFKRLDEETGVCDGWEENEILRIEMEDGVEFGISPESCLQLILAAGMACEALLCAMAGDDPMTQTWTYKDGRGTPQDEDED